MRTLYLFLTLLGTVLPLYAFSVHIQRHGMSLTLFISELWANPVTTGFTIDLLISSVVLWCFAGYQLKHRQQLRLLPIFILLNLCIGLSCALPAFCWWISSSEKL